MARHTKGEARAQSEIDKLRIKVIEKFFDLSETAFAHLKESMSAMRLCPHCSMDDKGNHKAGKAKDIDGKCSFCHGSYLIPDQDQRNWAFEQGADRFAPKPRSLEMNVDQTVHKDEIEQSVAKLSDEELNKKMDLLGIYDQGYA